MESKKLVIAGHRGQRAFVRRKTRDHRCRVREAALGQTDNAVLDEFFFCTVMTVSLGPPCSVLGGAPACFDSNDVGRDGADAQSSGDPGDYVGPFHGPVRVVDPGTWGIAVPILDGRLRAVAALGVVVPLQEMRLQALVPVLQTAARGIARGLNGPYT